MYLNSTLSFMGFGSLNTCTDKAKKDVLKVIWLVKEKGLT